MTFSMGEINFSLIVQARREQLATTSRQIFIGRK